MMRKIVPALAVLAGLSCTHPALADSLTYKVFVAGHGGGQPGTGKQVTVFTLYGLAATSLIGSAYFATQWSSSGDELDAFQAANPQGCSDFGSSACAETKRLESETNRNLNLALGGVAAGMTLTLSGVMVARFWDNDLYPSAVVVPGGGYLGLHGSF